MEMKRLDYNKWYWWFAYVPVSVQIGFGVHKTVWMQWVLRQYNKNRAATTSDPFDAYVYADEEGRKFRQIRDEEIYGHSP